MSGRDWRRLPPAGWQAMSGPWIPAGKTAEDMASLSEKVTFWVPKVNRWATLGFTIDGSPSNTLACQIGKHAADRSNSYFLQAYIPVTSAANYGRTLSNVLLIPEGGSYRLVVGVGRVSAGSQNILNCLDFPVTSTWAARTGPYGSVTYAPTTLCWTGSAIVGGSTSDSRICRSTNLGSAWSTPYDWGSSVTKVITNGFGVVLAFTTTGSYIRSTDHGATWTTGTLPDWNIVVSFHDAIWALGQFVVLNRDGDAWISKDGTFWTTKTKQILDQSFDVAKPQGRAYRSLAVVGEMLVAPFGIDGGGGSFSHFGILWSVDGYRWNQSGVLGTDFAPATNFGREMHIASSTPEHSQSPYSPIHSAMYYGGDISGSRGLFSPMEWAGVGGENEFTYVDEAGFEV